jgi:hypothetical protein
LELLDETGWSLSVGVAQWGFFREISLHTIRDGLSEEGRVIEVKPLAGPFFLGLGGRAG